MSKLDELKKRWFISMDETTTFGVPNGRHTADAGDHTLCVSTDGNRVTPLIDGQAFMKMWHEELGKLSGKKDEFFHSNWRFQGVKTLGETKGTTDALDDVNSAQNDDVQARVLTCRNLLVFFMNYPTIQWLRFHGVWTSCLDNRYPPGGSNHGKFSITKSGADGKAMLGSIDINEARWDTPEHLDEHKERDSDKPTHDIGVLIEGPAVADVEKAFRERWNDSTRTFGLIPLVPMQPRIASTVSTGNLPASVPATHSVQVLRTYGITSTFWGYSWSPRGEFTMWASYLNAIKKAKRYIYIEDQYFLPFDWPPCHTREGDAQESDLIYQLGEAIKRGVKIAVVTPSNKEDWTHKYQKYQRDVGVNYLRSIEKACRDEVTNYDDGEYTGGQIVVASLRTNRTKGPGKIDVYVHSKLMIVDDEFACIGSANIGQRSMTHDGEIGVGIVDGNENGDSFAKTLREALWAEHTARKPEDFDDNPLKAFETLRADVETPDNGAAGCRVFPYPVDKKAEYPEKDDSTSPPFSHGFAMRTIVDPYAGPPEIR